MAAALTAPLLPGIQLSSRTTPTGLVMLRVQVGAQVIECPVDPMYAIQIAMELYRSGRVACDCGTTQDRLYNDLRGLADAKLDDQEED
jgi:hypothetical protein